MAEDVTPTLTLQGRVKWFDPGKGFGFILADEGGTDILLHANVLRNFGQGSVSDGALIEVRVQQTARGRQATEVLAISPPEGVMLNLSDDGDPLPQDHDDLPLEPARVKWFDKEKGFGFANAFGRPEDIFVHVEVLRVSGFADLQAGEAIGLKAVEGKRGRMAVLINSWEMAVRK
ncbi:cold shock domain-containing protein [Rhodobacter sp. KR11]|jgi:CspA family cold shock protein|uniref:cold-shock protein n=1 Tax=Rhodobacter sp. KR11 TaxID=2974588 RepID=UPI0022232A7F|nr:cold shock domain-containing protein [Rhodobacter sp. KR11]MCW1920258.1 cold shock domain-containing protein [Rhodobacter sp. KR11]